jgi:choline dehydrogenase-like flavoprotein
MLIDANELPENSQIDCDICIAGSGPAGITIAAELSGAAMRVCLIESGGASPRAAVPTSTVAEQLGVSIDLAKFQQHVFGGASNRWGGLSGRWFRLKPMDPIDFEARPWVANSGWPFGHDTLGPFFERAGQILRVPSARDFSLDGQRERLAPELHNDDLRTTLFLMVKPLRFGDHYRSLFDRSPNIRVYFHGRVTEIEEDPVSPVIRHFRLATLAGKTHRVSAKYFVLACGGLENPRLLLASKSKMASGVGNQRDLVGRYYMQHPKGLHGLAILGHGALRTPLYTGGHPIRGVKTSAGICFSDEFQRRHQVLNHCIMFQPIFSLSEGYVSQVYRAMRRWWHGSDPDVGRRELVNLTRFAASALKRVLKGDRPGTVFSVLNHMEQIPKPESRLDLSERKDGFGVNQLRIDWRIDPEEKASLCRLHEVLRDRLAAQGAGRLESRLDALADDWPIAQDSAHHMGTTRMHSDPKRGVTDPHGRVHGLRNLYIGGNSVLPASGHANPTLTVIALGIRLAAHLEHLWTDRDAGSVVRPDPSPSRPVVREHPAEL